MPFDCESHHSKCKALCCKTAPIEKEIFERNQDSVTRPILDKIEFSGVDSLSGQRVGLVLPFTQDSYCPFLTQDLKCNIYDDRPKVCRVYGSEERACLMCPFQDKEGRSRSRQESRKILRDASKQAEKLIKLGGNSESIQER